MSLAQRDEYMSLYRTYLVNKTEAKTKPAQLEEILQ